MNIASTATVHPFAVIHPGVTIDSDCTIGPFCEIGSPDGTPLRIRYGTVIRSGTVIYGGVTLGSRLETGHHALIRGNVVIGHRCRVGSYSSVEGTVTVGDDTVIRGRCEVPNSIVGNRVQIYAGTIFYDTPQPPDGPNMPPVIEDDVVICCNASVLGGVTIGRGSMLAARAFATRDVPPGMFLKRNGDMVPRR